MQKNIAKFFLLGAICLLSGCALFHMSQEQCAAMNWEQEGFNDGLAGNMPRSLTNATQDCAKFGIVVNQDLYRKGWESGVKRFCSYEKGVEIGSQGSPAPTVCPIKLQAKFMNGWNDGVKRYCSNYSAAFSLGKNGQPYPAICSSYEYGQFRNEYDRGVALFNRMQGLRAHLDDLHREINHKIDQYHFTHEYDGYFRLGQDTSPAAREALELVNHLASESHRIEHELDALSVRG